MRMDRPPGGNRVSRGFVQITQAVFALLAVSCGATIELQSPVIDRTVAWEIELDAGGATASLFDEDTLVFTGYDLTTNSIEATEPGLLVGRVRVESGALIWERSMLPRGGAPSLERIDDVVIVRQGSAVEALDRNSGRYLWGVAFEHAPDRLAGARGVVVIQLPNGIVNARDARTGRHLWTIDTGDWAWRELHEADGRLYAIADRDQSDVAVFDATFPSATPLWSARVRGGAATTWTAGSSLFGRVDGIALRRMELRTGDPLGEAIQHADGWIGGLRLISTETQGIVLRMRRIDAFGPDDGDEPRWSTTLPSANAFDSMELVLDGDAVFLRSNGSSVLLDARGGEVVWRTTQSSGPQSAHSSCTTLGTTGEALIQGCGIFSTTRLVAVEISD